MATKTFTTFKLNEQLFGVEILYVREINKQMDITPVQHAPEYIRGLTNLRGQIVTVMDLLKRLSGIESTISEKSCNLIIKTDQELSIIRRRENREDITSAPDPVGLLVDDIDEIVAVDSEEIDPPPNNIGELEGKYLSGVIKLDGTLIGILSVKKLLTAGSQMSLSKA